MQKKELILGYEIQRKKVKNINIHVKHDLTIYISAPYNLDKYYIEQFLISKKNWIEKSLEKFKNYRKKYEEETLENDTFISYLGKKYKLYLNSDSGKIYMKNDIIYMGAINLDYNEKKKILDLWYYERAKTIFTEIINKYLLITEENIEKLKINKIKGKWGYCIPKKRIICLNTDLIRRSTFEIEYVIVHELVHLKVPNHSKLFYDNVKKIMPNYKLAEDMLKKIY